MKILVCMLACMMAVGCASATRKAYEKSVNDLMMKEVPVLAEVIQIPGADRLRVTEIILTKDNGVGTIVISAEDKNGKAYETIYLSVVCTQLGTKQTCIPAGLLTASFIKQIIKAKELTLGE